MSPSKILSAGLQYFYISKALRAFICACLSMSFLFCYSNAASKEQTNSSEWELSATAGIDQYKATELRNGKLFNRDTGHLKMLGLGIDYAGFAGWRLGADLQQSQGDMNYFGLTQTLLPFATISKVNFTQLDLHANRRFSISDSFWIAPGVGIRRTTWDRNIQPAGFITGLREDMTSIDARATVTASYRLQERVGSTAIALSAGYIRGLSNSLQINFQSGTDPFSLKPATASGSEIALRLSHAVNPALRLDLAWHSDHWRAGQSETKNITSAGQPLGTATYPGVAIKRQGWRFTLTKGW